MTGTTGIGVDAAKVAELLVRARREIDEGLLPSCQLALARDGKLVAFESYGAATNDTGCPPTSGGRGGRSSSFYARRRAEAAGGHRSARTSGPTVYDLRDARTLG